MEILNTSKEMLGFVFGRLRNQEGIERGRISSQISEEKVFKVLANAKFKMEHGQILTELERLVKKENGNYIFMYVSQKYEEAKKLGPINHPPYLELSNLTLADLTSKKPLLSPRIA